MHYLKLAGSIGGICNTKPITPYMKLLTLIFSIGFYLSAFTQSNSDKVEAHKLAKSFVGALKQENFSSLLGCCVISTSQIKEYRAIEKKMMMEDNDGVELSKEEQDYYNITDKGAEQHRELIIKTLTARFNHLLKVSKEEAKLNWKDCKIDSVQLDFIEGNELDMGNIIVHISNKPPLIISNVNIMNNEVTLFDASEFAIEGFYPNQIMAKKLIQGLKEGSYENFLKSFVPDTALLNSFCKATAETYTANLRSQLFNQLRKEFNNLMITGQNDGIDWSKVELNWVGSVSEYVNDQIYKFSIPFQFKHKDSQYRVVIEKAFLLNNDPYVLSGLIWEGKLK